MLLLASGWVCCAAWTVLRPVEVDSDVDRKM